MNDEQIFELAEKNSFQDDSGCWIFKDEGLLDFVFMVQKAEREACAVICEEVANKHARVHYSDLESVADECAGAIRAREKA